MCCISKLPSPSVWLDTVRDFTGHQDSAKHKKNHIFKIYQKEKEKLLRNPHSLGLEIRVAEPDQGVEHNSEQVGLALIASWVSVHSLVE